MLKWRWNLKLWFRIRRAHRLASDMHYLAHVAWWDGDDEASKEFHKTALYIEQVENELDKLWDRPHGGERRSSPS